MRESVSTTPLVDEVRTKCFRPRTATNKVAASRRRQALALQRITRGESQRAIYLLIYKIDGSDRHEPQSSGRGDPKVLSTSVILACSLPQITAGARACRGVAYRQCGHGT